MTLIRPVMIEDLPNMAEGARVFYDSSRFLVGFKLDRFCAFWKGLIEAGSGVIFGLFDGQRVCGAIGAIMCPDPYSGELQCGELFWFCLPEYRGQGVKLLKTLERWAKIQGCSVMRMVHLADSMPEKLERVYGRMGYELVEKHYQKLLEPAA